MQAEGVSERRACGLAGQQRSTQRYAPRPRGDDEPVKESLHRLASRWPRFGLPRLAYLVREELGPVNRKRICRLYREAGLQLPRKRKGRRRGSGRTGLAERPVRPLHRWSMDFVSDTFADGRRLRVLAVIDNFTRACLALEVDTSLGAERVVRVLRRLAEIRGLPERLLMDNGPEFTSRALWQWSRDAEVALDFIAPGKPTQNGHCESFNGKLRDECLSRHYFTTLDDARTIIEQWREHYNTERPHSALGYQTPNTFQTHWEANNSVEKQPGKLSLTLEHIQG